MVGLKYLNYFLLPCALTGQTLKVNVLLCMTVDVNPLVTKHCTIIIRLRAIIKGVNKRVLMVSCPTSCWCI